jgi:hypothetical protein
MASDLTGMGHEGWAMFVRPARYIAGELLEPLPSVGGSEREKGLRLGALRYHLLGVGLPRSHGAVEARRRRWQEKEVRRTKMRAMRCMGGKRMNDFAQTLL